MQNVKFELSTDAGRTWAFLGFGTRIADGWQATGLNLPASGLLRATAHAVGGNRRNSSSISVAIIAFPANSSPTVASPIEPITVNEDAPRMSIDLRAVFRDMETPASDLRFDLQANSDPSLLSGEIDNGTGILSLRFLPNRFGTASITLRATDAMGLDVEHTFVVMVRQVADGDPGDLDVAFAPNPDFDVSTAAVQPDGKILIGRGGGPFAPGRIARLKPDGSLDGDFNASADRPISIIAVQADEKVLIAGGFTKINEVARRGIARLNADGTLDLNFVPNVEAPVNGYSCLAVQADGKILIGGGFRLVRLNMNATLDSSFDSGNANKMFRFQTVRCLAIQPDGKILLGADFLPPLPPGPIIVGSLPPSPRIIRLNADGSSDIGFAPNVSFTSSVAQVDTIVIQPDGKILIGGLFDRVDGTRRDGIARLLPDGKLDPTFSAPRSSGNIALQTDGKIITTRSLPRSTVRLNTDGNIDDTFNSEFSTSEFWTSIGLQANGKVILLIATFTNVTGLPRIRLAQLENDPALSSLAVTGPNRIEWLRGGTSPEAQEVVFYLSMDMGRTWTALGNGIRIPGGWERTGLNLPASGLVRARARLISNGSSGLIEAMAAFPKSSARPAFVPSSVRLSSTGAFQFGLLTEAGKQITIETSTNLTSWIQWTNFTSPGTLINLSDTVQATGRFYRAIAR